MLEPKSTCPASPSATRPSAHSGASGPRNAPSSVPSARRRSEASVMRVPLSIEPRHAQLFLMSPARLPGTPRLLRALNDRAALELLLTRGPLTRAQLGEMTGLSKVTASQLVERLEERGLVRRVGEQAGGRGPNAQLYAVTPGSAHVIGVEVGPDQV